MELFPTDNFGQRVAALVRAERDRTGKCDYERLAELTNEEFARTVSREKRLTRKVAGEHFDCLTRCCGMNYKEMTKAESRTTATALALIREAMPAVTREEIERRVGKYRRTYPGIAVTPMGLAGKWSSLGNGANGHARPNAYAEPVGWQNVFRVLGARNKLDADEVERLCAGSWFDMSITVRLDIIKEIK